VLTALLTFPRLQAVGGSPAGTMVRRRAEPSMPGTVAATSARSTRRHWLSHALRKELRLQSLAGVVAVLFTLLWYGLVLSRPLMPDALLFAIPLPGVTVLYNGRSK
jgi:hypothetical protein